MAAETVKTLHELLHDLQRGVSKRTIQRYISEMRVEYDGNARVVTVKLPVSMVRDLDVLGKDMGVSRSDLIRAGVFLLLKILRGKGSSRPAAIVRLTS